MKLVTEGKVVPDSHPPCSRGGCQGSVNPLTSSSASRAWSSVEEPQRHMGCSKDGCQGDRCIWGAVRMVARVTVAYGVQ